MDSEIKRYATKKNSKIYNKWKYVRRTLWKNGKDEIFQELMKI